jgi:general secretion pathway protein J
VEFGLRGACPLIPKSGFTLIEILISLTLLTVVLGAVYSSFFSVQRALERFDNVSLKYHEARTALDIIRREIEGALVKNPQTDNNKKMKAVFVIKDSDIFGKNTSSLNLTAFSFKGSNPNTISYFVKEKDGRLELLKTESPAAIPSKEYQIEIIEEIESFTVEILFNKKWVKTWDTANTGKLPEIVKISIEFDDKGKIVKLTEYAKPKIGTQL